MLKTSQLLASLYDSLYELLTHTPPGAVSTELSKHKDTIRVQMTQNEVLNLDDYKGALSGDKPNGDLAKAEAFSTFVDNVPNLDGAQWAPTKGLAKFYQNMVRGANVNPDLLPSEEQEALYKKLQGLLRQEIEKTSLLGEKTVSIDDSPRYKAYKEAKRAYDEALLNAAQVAVDADLSTNAGKRQASIDKRRADIEVKARYNDWVAAGKSDVEEVLDTLESIKNNAISAAVNDAKTIMDDTKWISSGYEFSQPWMLVSATPSNWTEPTCKGTTLSLSSDSLKTSTSSTANTYADNSQGWFWWSDSSSSGSTETKDVEMDTNSFKLSAELVLVRVERPWLNKLLFTMKGWSTNAYSKEKPISDGKGGGALPGIPIAFVMARNVTITTKFSESASNFIHSKSETTSNGGWGWGPFGGSKNHSTSDSTTDKFSQDGDTFTLSFSQPQLIAWISSLVPACPP